MSSVLRQTPLHSWHVAHGGRMVDFAGWSMPVQYTSIVAEHTSTRTAAGLFDISHMGRFRFDGPGSVALLDWLLTRHVAPLAPGQVAYSLITNEEGGILDDVLVYHLQDAAATSYYLLVVNADNRQKIAAWIDLHRAAAPGARVTDVTDDWGMIAVQGPRALQITQPLVAEDLLAMDYYSAAETTIAGHGGIVGRTGYTGEDGCELIVGCAALSDLWERLVRAAFTVGGQPVGLGARDTLRLEAGMPLYGHELSEDIDPLQAGLGFAVQLDKGPFVGREALKRLKADPSRPRRVGLVLDGKRVAREGHAIYPTDAAAASRGRGGSAQPPADPIGFVTSGTFSPTLELPIAMGYLAAAHTQHDTRVAIDIRGRLEPARVAKLPFYRRRPAAIADHAVSNT